MDAIQAIIIQARFIAYNQGSHEDIAWLLDQAEYLTGRISLNSPNCPEIFRTVLEELSIRFPVVRYIYDGFVENLDKNDE